MAKEIRKCAWDGCKSTPFTHKFTAQDGTVSWWVVCDTTTDNGGRLHVLGHMVVGPEAATEDEAIELWNARTNRTIGRPRKA